MEAKYVAMQRENYLQAPRTIVAMVRLHMNPFLILRHPSHMKAFQKNPQAFRAVKLAGLLLWTGRLASSTAEDLRGT